MMTLVLNVNLADNPSFSLSLSLDHVGKVVQSVFPCGSSKTKSTPSSKGDRQATHINASLSNPLQLRPSATTTQIAFFFFLSAFQHQSLSPSLSVREVWNRQPLPSS
ncbi:hypothetical protein VTJ04DRAFT_584 [Mycothermus thermophilus]|uniref:uncharacterized protein n=1 Tax=Humicola insolens TaxID=85995 RepID=UPI0037431281